VFLEPKKIKNNVIDRKVEMLLFSVSGVIWFICKLGNDLVIVF